MSFLKSLLVCVWLLLARSTGEPDALVGGSAEVGDQQGAPEAPDGAQYVDLNAPQGSYDAESTSDDVGFPNDKGSYEDEGNFYGDEGNADDASTSSDFDVSDTDADSEAPTDTSDEGDCLYYEDELSDAPISDSSEAP